MKDQYVPYNVAKRLKDLGFEEPCIFAYDEVPMACTMSESPFEPLNYNSPSGGGYVSAPLWQQVTAWLRDKKQINIYVGFRINVKKWDGHYYDMNLTGKEYAKVINMDHFMKRKVFDTYEDALENTIIDWVNNTK